MLCHVGKVSLCWCTAGALAVWLAKLFLLSKQNTDFFIYRSDLLSLMFILCLQYLRYLVKLTCLIHAQFSKWICLLSEIRHDTCTNNCSNTVVSPAMGHWGKCPLDFKQFPFLVYFGVNLIAKLSKYCVGLVCEVLPYLFFDRQHLSYDGCLEVRGEIIKLFCPVLCIEVVQSQAPLSSSSSSSFNSHTRYYI